MKRVISLIFAIFVMVGCAAYAATYMTLNAKEEILQGELLNASDTYKIAFYDSSSTCSASFGDSYTTTNLVGLVGGYTVSTNFTTNSLNTAAWIDDFSEESANVITLGTVTFSAASDCAIIYNDSHTTDDVLLIFDISPPIQPSSETVTLTFPTDDSDNAIIRLR